MKTSKCKTCSTEIPSNAKVCPKCGAKNKKPIHKKWWFWAIIVWLLLGFVTLIASCSILANSLSSIDPNDFTFPTFAIPDPDTTQEPTTPTTEPTIPTTEAPTEQPTEAVTSQLDEYIGKPLTDFMAKVEELGYTATYYNQGVDFTDILGFYTEEDCESFLIGEIEEDPEAKTVVVDLLSKSNVEAAEQEAALREKLETGSAWIAVENYGEIMYGESFKLDYFFGKIAEYAEDENTWFLKAECTVSGVDKTCEAKVTGTSDNPEVIYFEIY